MEGELVIISKMRYALLVKQSFPRRRLPQALAVKGVAAAAPLYVENARGLWQPAEAPRRSLAPPPGLQRQRAGG